MSEPFIGEIKMIGYNFAPRGWALCDGQLLPISQNTALFSILGTTYGGDGRSTFALPDLRGRAPLQQGGGPGLSPYFLGEKTGSESVTLTAAQMASHSHQWQVNDELANQTAPQNNALAQSQSGRGGFALYGPGSGGTAGMSGSLLGNAGNGQPHDNMQPTLVMNFVIALQGLYPSRS